MKIRTIASIAATLALSAQAFADAAEAQKEMVYPVHPSKMAEWNAKTGGLVPPPEFAKHLLFLDARAENVPNLAKFAGPAERMLSLAIETKKIQDRIHRTSVKATIRQRRRFLKTASCSSTWRSSSAQTPIASRGASPPSSGGQ